MLVVMTAYKHVTLTAMSFKIVKAIIMTINNRQGSHPFSLNVHTTYKHTQLCTLLHRLGLNIELN